jgi:hypothetical protein
MRGIRRGVREGGVGIVRMFVLHFPPGDPSKGKKKEKKKDKIHQKMQKKPHKIPSCL